MGEGETLAIAQTAMKYYPCNYYIQSVNDAVLQLAARPDLQLDAIESIVVNTVQAAMALVCEPIEQKRRPKVMIDAQFSVPFNVALGLVKRRVSFVDFTPAEFADPEIVAPDGSCHLSRRSRIGRAVSSGMACARGDHTCRWPKARKPPLRTPRVIHAIH